MWGILKVVGGLELCQPLLDPRLEFTLVSIVDDVDQPVRALVVHKRDTARQRLLVLFGSKVIPGLLVELMGI